jgi:hypothetical protein
MNMCRCMPVANRRRTNRTYRQDPTKEGQGIAVPELTAALGAGEQLPYSRLGKTN